MKFSKMLDESKEIELRKKTELDNTIKRLRFGKVFWERLAFIMVYDNYVASSLWMAGRQDHIVIGTDMGDKTLEINALEDILLWNFQYNSFPFLHKGELSRVLSTVEGSINVMIQILSVNYHIKVTNGRFTVPKNLEIHDCDNDAYHTYF